MECHFELNRNPSWKVWFVDGVWQKEGDILASCIVEDVGNGCAFISMAKGVPSQAMRILFVELAKLGFTKYSYLDFIEREIPSKYLGVN